MKATVLILSVLIIQTGASFFNELPWAMTSVENAFSKLLNDVVTDVKNTVHCTILAVEHVLAMSGAISEPSDYSKECNDENVLNTTSDTLLKTSQNVNLTDDIAQHVSKTIANVNKTLNNILNNNGSHEGLESIKRVLINETNHLTEVSVLLKRELEKISYKISEELINKFDSNKSPLESLWNEMKLIHEVEKNDKNISEVNEITSVLNEAINVLHLNNATEIKTDEDKIKIIMRNLEDDSNYDNDVVANIDQELRQWNEDHVELSSVQDNHTPSDRNINEIYKDTEILNEEDIKEIEKKHFHGW